MPKTYTCQFCGQTFIDKSYHKARKYCSVECKNLARRKRVTLRCRYCSAEFEVLHCQQDTHKYCSKECRLMDGWTQADPSKRSVFTCEWCHKKFEEWTYRKPRFCSSQCRSEYAAHLPKPWQRKPNIHILRTCAFCGRRYKTTIHQIRLRGSRFCSTKCKNAQMSIDRRGEKNPHWSGGTLGADAYGPNWGRQRRRAAKRDKHTCQNCGYQAGGDHILDVHHIIPLRDFDGDWQAANKLSNLITLCRPCHIQIESGQILCPRPRATSGTDPL